MLIGGRSSSAFLVEPGWDDLTLVRLAPSEGPSLGNRAHLALLEVIAAVRRGEAGPGWSVLDDEPLTLDPEAMLSALREDPAARDRRLVTLAREVAEERERLMDERAALAEERAMLAAERARRATARPAAAPRPVANPVAVPRTADEAAALLGRPPGRPGDRGRARLPRSGDPLPPGPGRRPAPGHPGTGRGPHRGAQRGARPACSGGRRRAALSAPAGSASRATARPFRGSG